MKKITKRIAAIGLSMFLMGGLFISVTNTTTQIISAPKTGVSVIDPPGY